MKKLIAILAMQLLLQQNSFAGAPKSEPGENKENAPASGIVQKLPLRRVILYSNGVAYFERRGTISGQAEIDLSFKQSQVDDVLKSLVVLDLGHGRIGAVSYNSSQPPSARLAEIPFSIQPGTDKEGESGLAGVLRQLQGAEVTVTTSTRSATGAILTLEERKVQTDKGPSTTRALVISSASGEISNFDLQEIRSLKLLDEDARHDIGEFARASASARRRDAKTITITSEGTGPREMVVSYTISAPVWKTTYRAVLDSSDKPFLQGWAIVDNVGEQAWENISLSLVSGTPVSFIQPIQQPLYRYRPVIPIPHDLQLTPQVYEPDTGEDYGVEGGVAGGVPGGVPGRVVGGVPGGVTGSVSSPPPPPPPAEMEDDSAPETTLSDAITGGESGVRAAATGSEVGDLFEYRIDQPVTVPRDRSALIPILQTRMDGERVSIYNESVRKERPVTGIRLKNTSKLTLEAGSMTVIDQDAYAGEALIERLKPGEERFISFGLDLGTLVTARNETGREPVFLVRAVNGNLQAHYYQKEKKVYLIRNQTDRPRSVYVEHPVREGWALSKDTVAPSEKTAGFYRFRIELAPRATADLAVSEQRALMDSYSISSITTDTIELFVSRNYIDEATGKVLDGLIEIKQKIASLDGRMEAIDREVSEISSDQTRLRENIKALKETAGARLLIARYISKAGDQESRIEQLRAEKKTVAAERSALQKQLNKSIAAITIDRKL